jgi:hypothetical protein
MDVVSREEIKPRVVEKIMVVAHVSDEPSEEAALFEDLRMGATVRRAMALPYSRITDEFGGLLISGDEAEALETVGESIDLVFNRANGRDS